MWPIPRYMLNRTIRLERKRDQAEGPIMWQARPAFIGDSRAFAVFGGASGGEMLSRPTAYMDRFPDRNEWPAQGDIIEDQVSGERFLVTAVKNSETADSHLEVDVERIERPSAASL